MKKAELLLKMRSERENWEALIAQFDESQLEQPGPEGDWSVKDIVAHVNYYEKWLLNWLEAAVRGKVTVASHRDTLDVDARNALIFEENRHRSIQDVLAESRRVFQQLLHVVEVLPESDLADPHRFERYVIPFWSKSEPLWQCIAGDTYEHYQQHIPTLKARLEQRNVPVLDPAG